MVFLLNVSLGEILILRVLLRCMSIADICMVFPLNDSSCELLADCFDWLHMGSADIYMVSRLNVFSDEVSI